MKRKLFLISGFLFLLPAVISFSQEGLIPRRVVITAIGTGMNPMTTTILYSRLTRVAPLVLAGENEVSNNTITLETGELTALTLYEDGNILDRREFPGKTLNDVPAMIAVFDEVADSWRPFLNLVEPAIIEDVVVRREIMKTEISFEESLGRPFQATFWAPVAARSIILTDGDSRGTDWIGLWPLRADIAWFFTENLGITGSFRFEYGSHISFGSDLDDNIKNTTATMLMPAVGIQVRTIGRVSAEFGISLFFGAVHVRANEVMEKPALSPGESTWVFYPVFSIEPAIVWSLSEDWSVKFRVLGIDLGWFGRGDNASYGTAGNTLIINYLQVGGSYRW